MCGIFLNHPTTPTARNINKTKGKFLFNIPNSYSETICSLMRIIWIRGRSIPCIFFSFIMVQQTSKKLKTDGLVYCTVRRRIHSCTGCIRAPLYVPPIFCGFNTSAEEAWWTRVSTAPLKMPNVQQRQAGGCTAELPAVNICETFPTRK